MIECNVLWHGAAIAAAIGLNFNESCDRVIARVVNDHLMGGVIYQDYTGACITMHVAGFQPMWCSKDLVWACFHYPFIKLKLRKVIAPVSSGNAKSLEFTRHLGFKEEAVISDVYLDGNCHIMAMQRDDCRWLKLRPSTIGEGNRLG